MDDGVSGLWEVKDMSWNEIFRSSEFKSLYQLHYVFLYFYYHVFGTNSFAYFIWFVILQSAVVTSFYYSMPRLSALFGVSGTKFLYFITGLTIMTSPHNLENIAWAATSHYNLTFLFYFIMLAILVDGLSGKKKGLVLFYALLVLALFTMEMSVLFPLSFGLIVGLYWVYNKNNAAFRRALMCYVLPSFVLVLCSFALLKLLNNVWFPRSGAVSSFIPSISDAVTNYWSYCIQAIGYTHFLSFTGREQFYGVIKNNGFWAGLILILGIVFYCFKNKKYLLLIFFISSGIFLLPNLYRWGSILNRYENVRFLYFALPFIIGCVLFVFRKRKFLFGLIASLFLVANVFFLITTIHDKRIAGKIHETYLSELQNFKNNDVYLLNVPSFGQGTFIFRGYNRVRIADAMNNKNHEEVLYKEVLWYYAQSCKDSFTVEKMDSQTIRVTPRTDGVWLMIENVGASSYENDNFSVTLGEWGNYDVRFKNPLAENSKVLLFSSGTLKNCSDILLP